MKRLVLVATMIGVMGSGLAWAQTVALKPEDVVRTRQAGMDMTAALTDTIKAGIAAGVEPKTLSDQASALAAWAKAYPALFPDGTQDVAGTKAKAEIWSDRAGFEKAGAAFITASANLEAAAKSGDKAALATALQAEGQTCGACHRPYKAR